MKQHLKTPFIRLPKLPLNGDGSICLSQRAVTALVIICSSMDNDTNECFAARKKLADKAGIHVRTFDLAIKELEEQGLITVTHRFNNSNIYKVNFVSTAIAQNKLIPGKVDIQASLSLPDTGIKGDIVKYPLQKLDGEKAEEVPNSVTATEGKDDWIECPQLLSYVTATVRDEFNYAISHQDALGLCKAANNNGDVFDEAVSRCKKSKKSIEHVIPYLKTVITRINPDDVYQHQLEKRSF